VGVAPVGVPAARRRPVARKSEGRVKTEATSQTPRSRGSETLMESAGGLEQNVDGDGAGLHQINGNIDLVA
jgi:hypothetical protein